MIKKNFFFFAVPGFELRAYTLSNSTSPIFVKGIFELGSLLNYLPGLASNRDPPDLCLLSSWDYRREHAVSSQYFMVWGVL
jgi:hypothetical protein